MAGYTGPGGKTVLPHRAVAKLDLRLVPDMTFDGAVAALKAHLAKRGFGDIEVNPSGGYDPTSTAADAPLIRAADRRLQARRARSRSCGRATPARIPGYVFTERAARAARRPTSASATAAARTRPTSTSSSSPSNPKVAGLGRRGAVVRRLPVRAGRRELERHP